jgi:hypothetical protein
MTGELSFISATTERYAELKAAVVRKRPCVEHGKG